MRAARVEVARNFLYTIFPENKEFSHCLKIANCISRAIIYWDLLDCPPKPTPRAAPWKKSENWSRLVASAMK